ncbi:MAG: HPr(Ser) kinase/phosphatase [Eubacterium sp.]|nr:HPr(Ser) kinase/phosphatase [Eubacterium sp.]
MSDAARESIKLDELLKGIDLEYLTPSVDTSNIRVTTREVHRPGFQLTGYFESFPYQRILIIGKVEYNYIQLMDKARRTWIFEKMFSYDVPAIIFCRGNRPDEEILKIAEKNNVPVYLTQEETSPFMGVLITELGEVFAPFMTVHGVLVDCYGEGLLIMGESGIGKSEAALELIRRGHRLVADDVVEIRRVNEWTLVGTAPEVTQYFLEVRGIGMIDVKMLFGVESIKPKQNIDIVIKLEEWEKGADYDRIGLDEKYINFLGLDVVCQELPIRPGRNLAVICEVAAINHRQKKMGYNAAQELYRRVEENMLRKQQERLENS